MKTIWGDLPPSSSITGAKWAAAAVATLIPVAVEPVNATLFTPGCETSGCPTEGPSPVTTLRTPGGNPASAVSLTNASVLIDVCSAGFKTKVQPAASPGPSL